MDDQLPSLKSHPATPGPSTKPSRKPLPHSYDVLSRSLTAGLSNQEVAQTQSAMILLLDNGPTQVDKDQDTQLEGLEGLEDFALKSSSGSQSREPVPA